MWYDHARRYVSTDLATWLQRMMEEKGLSCRAIAAGIGISLPSFDFPSFFPSLLLLVKWRSRPKPDPVQKIATYFRAGLFYLCELAGYKPYESHYEVISELEEEIRKLGAMSRERQERPCPVIRVVIRPVKCAAP